MTEQNSIYADFVGEDVIARYNTEEGQRTAKGKLLEVSGQKLKIVGTYNKWVLDIDVVVDVNLLKQ